MNNTLLLILMVTLIVACGDKKQESSFPHGWKERNMEFSADDSLYTGTTYLPVYSEIYGRDETRTFQLTATVSIRNISETDSIFIVQADYYNTKGERIRRYIDHPIFVKPLETIEIVIPHRDKVGGTGANFILNWKSRTADLIPHIEAVMISSTQQGHSFTTQGVVRRK